MKRHLALALGVTTLASLLLQPVTAAADPPSHVRRHCPPHGWIVVDLPPGPRVAHHRGHRCYYGHGAWYRAHGPRYVAVHPPVGLTVSFLPAFSATMHVGDARYYRAGPVYYTWSPRVRGYVVTDGPY